MESPDSSLGKLLAILEDNSTYTPRPPIVTVESGAVQISSERFYVGELWQLVKLVAGYQISFIITQSAPNRSEISALIRQPSTFDTTRTLDKFEPSVLTALPPLWNSILSAATFQKDPRTNTVTHRLSFSQDNNTATITFSEGTVVVDFGAALASDPRVSGVELTAVAVCSISTLLANCANRR